MQKNLLVFIFLTSFTLQAQKTKDQRFTTVQTIYQNLLESKGLLGKRSPLFALPVLEMYKSEESAYYNQSENVIVFSYKLYDLLAKLDENAPKAIAFVLGHELTHFYQQHELHNKGFIPSKKLFAAHLQEEGEADIQGAFLAYLAGYDATDLIPEILEMIYEAYGLGEVTDYPRLIQRKQCAHYAMETVRELILLFETAGFMVAAGDYEEAMHLYEYVNRHFHSRELYNNMGITRFKQALSYVADHNDRSALRFTYPSELDQNFRLYAPRFKEMMDGIYKYLRDSEAWFRAAIEMDNNYLSAVLHLASVYDVMEYFCMDKELTSMELIAHAASREMDAEDRAKLLIIKGIIVVHQEANLLKARELFSKAAHSSANAHLTAVAGQNIAALTKESVINENPQNWGQNPDNQIDGFKLDFLVAPDWDNEIRLEKGAKISFKRSSDNVLVEFSDDDGSLLLHRLQNGKKATRDGIQIGDSKTQVADKMGLPSTSLSSSNGYYWMYKKELLIFYFNKKNRVKEWAVFW